MDGWMDGISISFFFFEEYYLEIYELSFSRFDSMVFFFETFYIQIFKLSFFFGKKILLDTYIVTLLLR